MTTMPAEITYGHVTGRFIAAWTDGVDGDRMPDPRPLEGLTVKITPKVQVRRLAGASPVLVATMPVTCGVDADGALIDEQGTPGVWLVTGIYGVTYAHPAVTIPAHDIEVTDAHTEGAPLDLVTAMPPGGPVLTASQYAELSARIDGIVVEAGGVLTVNGATGNVVLDAADVGAATTAQGALADTAVQPADVTDVIREGDARLTDARTPTSHAHVYADITDPPTIPGPQTLSLTGTNLTLSGGGGTVTLPSGGWGGGDTYPTRAGRWMSNPNFMTVGSNEYVRANNDMPLTIPEAMSLDAVSIEVLTAPSAPTSAVVNLLDGSKALIQKLTDLTIDATTGAKTATFAPVAVTAGTYFIQLVGITYGDAGNLGLKVNQGKVLGYDVNADMAAPEFDPARSPRRAGSGAFSPVSPFIWVRRA